MSLSTGTLNLKFMQRAAARNATKANAEAGTQSATNSGSSTAGPSRAGEAAQSRTTPQDVDTPGSSGLAEDGKDADESEGRWFIPRNNKGKEKANPDAVTSPWTFDSSYMSFMPSGSGASSSHNIAGSNSASGSATAANGVSRVGGESGGGAGRMRFGGFGAEPEEPEVDDDDEDDDEDGNGEKRAAGRRKGDGKREKRYDRVSCAFEGYRTP